MNKTLKYSINGAIIVGSINALLNYLNQKEEQKNNFNKKIDRNRMALSFGKGFIFGGTTGAILGHWRDNEMKALLLKNGGTSEYLRNQLDDCSDNNQILIRKANQLRRTISKRFQDDLSEYPTLKGSITRGTQISNSDVDIEVKFQKSAGSVNQICDNLKLMIEEEHYDPKLKEIRDQKHSIGLTYELYNKTHKIDLIPNREIENGKGDTFILRKSQSVFEKPKLIKTNSRRHNEMLKLTPKQKTIVQLLKKWKQTSDLKLPSIMLELIVKKSFNEMKMPYGLENSFLKVIEYLRDNITTIKIIDPANSNNIISNSLQLSQKKIIQKLCVKMLIEVRENNFLLLDYFPEIE